MTESKPQRRWYRLTPDRLVLLLLVVECLLWLSNRLGWLGRHKGYAVLASVAIVGLATIGMLVWFGVALVFSRRFQFGIRTLLVLTLAVALPFSWLAAELRKAKEQQATIEEIRSIGGQVTLESEIGDDMAQKLAPLFPSPKFTPSPEPERLRELLPDGFFDADDVVEVLLCNSAITDAGLQRLEWLDQLKKLDLNLTRVTDAGLIHLKHLKNLQTLCLERTVVSDTGLKSLGSLNSLQTLDLCGTKIADTGLGNLGGLSGLQSLDVGGTQVTDPGLADIAGFHELRWLRLSDNQITDAGLARLESLTKLEHLFLDNTKITAAGLAHLRGMVHLCELHLNFTRMTSQGLETLQGLNALNALWLLGTKVDEEGVKDLHRALPNRKIEWEP